MKTNKHQTLMLVHTKGHVLAKDLVQQFGYSPGTARSYLSYLKRQDLLARIGQGHVLTDRGGARLQYFDVAGCGYPACPFCEKKAGSFTCSRCGYQVPTKEAQDSARARFSVGVSSCGGVLPPLPQGALHGTASPTSQDSCGGHMKQVGWEIQPLGWLLLIVIVATVCYVVVRWVCRLPPAPEQEA